MHGIFELVFRESGIEYEFGEEFACFLRAFGRSCDIERRVIVIDIEAEDSAEALNFFFDIAGGARGCAFQKHSRRELCKTGFVVSFRKSSGLYVKRNGYERRCVTFAKDYHHSVAHRIPGRNAFDIVAREASAFGDVQDARGWHIGTGGGFGRRSGRPPAPALSGGDGRK